jgi:hypothetical protein
LRGRTRTGRNLVSTPILGIARQDRPQPHGHFHADLATERHGPHQPYHRFHADIRGFDLIVSGLGPPAVASLSHIYGPGITSLPSDRVGTERETTRGTGRMKDESESLQS